MKYRKTEQAVGLICPAAKQVLKGEPFDLDGDLFYVEDYYRHGVDATRDVLVIRGVEYMRCHERPVRRAIQVREVEKWIAQDRVCFPLGPSALELNIAKGWPTEPGDAGFYGPDYEHLYKLLFTSDHAGGGGAAPRVH